MNTAATNTTGRWFRFNLWLHRWTSLIATIPFLILCITGTFLIFHEEIEAALGEVPVSQHAAETPQRPASESIANVLKAYPGERVMSVGLDPEHHPGVMLVVTGPNDARSFEQAKVRFTDLVTAQPVGDPDPGMTFTGFLLELHAEWFLGPIGELVGAMIALLVFLSLVSGIVVYAPYVRRMAFGFLRRGKGTRLLQLDLHNFIGAVVLGWALVVTVTGFLLGFNAAAIGIWQVTALGPLRAAAERMEPVDARHPPVDIDRAYAATQAAAPEGWTVSTMIYPSTEFSTPRHYTALLAGNEGIDERLFRVMILDAKTGEVVLNPEVPGYLKAISLAQPLHFGDYGGLELKLLWTACTWLTLFITANGAWLWWDRRKKRQPRLEGVPA